MFDPNNFLNLATRLKDSSNEAEIRTSISRAYYAAFLIAREWLVDRSETFPNDGRDHNLVAQGLKRHIDRTTGDKLKHLCRRMRGKADYDLNLQFSSFHANDAIRMANVIIGNCN